MANKMIYKYELFVVDAQTVSLNKDAQILCVQEQYWRPCIWVLQDLEQPKTMRTIIMHGTGHPANDVSKEAYLGTFQTASLVFHVFDGGEC